MRREKKGGGYKEMTRYQDKGYEKMKKDDNSNGKFVEKSKGTYRDDRYKGLVSPEKDIVEGPVKPSYPSRYK